MKNRDEGQGGVEGLTDAQPLQRDTMEGRGLLRVCIWEKDPPGEGCGMD